MSSTSLVSVGAGEGLDGSVGNGVTKVGKELSLE